nr:ubiquitin carboxyl-terminal hydrolase 13-like isoform X1 [Tanacetum cinerariifolium]
VSDILYYEVLDIPLPELQGLKTLKIAFHHATKKEVELSHPDAELGLLEVFYHKIFKIVPPTEKIENINDKYWTLRAEEEEFIFENSDTTFESFYLFHIPIEDSDSLMEDIDLSFTQDDPMPPGIKEDDYDSARDILILKELLSNDSLSLPENESFHFNIPSSSRPLAKPPDGNTRILNVKVMGGISEHKVLMPRLMFTLVLNEENSLNLLTRLGHEAFQPSTECPMMIYGNNTPILDVSFLHFYSP